MDVSSSMAAFPGYLTPVDLIRLKLTIDGELNTSAQIKNLIIADTRSQAKQDIQTGINYYRGEHDIRNREITYWDGVTQKVDSSKANNKIANPFMKLLVDQKVSYIVGKPITYTCQDKKLEELLNEQLGDWFGDILTQWVQGACNKGIEFIHVYIDEDGELDYAIIPAEQVIPVYDSQFQKKIMYLIRYYVMEVQDENTGVFQQRYKVEWWTKDKVEFFMETSNGYFIPDDTVYPNPRFHWVSFNTIDPTNVEGNSWGRVPFVELPNNDYRRSDLYSIKALIDIYDMAISDWANNLVDIQEAVWKLIGYSGTDLKTFLSDLKTFKAIKLDTDGDAEPLKIEIPYESRENFLKVVEKNIYELGQGVNMGDENLGTASGTALKYRYGGLDLKAHVLIRKLKYSLKYFMWFVIKYINMKNKTNFDPNDIEFTINTSVIVNELERVQELQLSLPMLSKETILANHPLVDNVRKELERIEDGQFDIPTNVGLGRDNLDNTQLNTKVNPQGEGN